MTSGLVERRPSPWHFLPCLHFLFCLFVSITDLEVEVGRAGAWGSTDRFFCILKSVCSLPAPSWATSQDSSLSESLADCSSYLPLFSILLIAKERVVHQSTTPPRSNRVSGRVILLPHVAWDAVPRGAISRPVLGSPRGVAEPFLLCAHHHPVAWCLEGTAWQRGKHRVWDQAGLGASPVFAANTGVLT